MPLLPSVQENSFKINIEMMLLLPQFILVLLNSSAVIEHTNRVIYLEDNDVASVVDGSKREIVMFKKLLLA